MKSIYCKYYGETAFKTVSSGSPFLGHLEAFCREASRSEEFLTKELALLQRLTISAHVENLANRLDIFSRQTILLEQRIYQDATGHKWKNLEDFHLFLQENTNVLEDIFDNYPALTQILDALTENFIRNCGTFFRRLVSDFESVTKSFGDNRRLGEISSLELTSGELHNGSQSVIVIHVGQRPYCLYKPRDLHIEERLTLLLRKLATCDPVASGWKLPRYVAREQYGWAEWIENRQAECEDDVEKFFHRAGFLLGFSEMLGITDLHFGNIIASGDSPVPIDLEAALSITMGDGSDFEQWNLLGTGMLPSSTWKGGDQVGIDICGLGCLNDQYCSMPVVQNAQKSEAGENFTQTGVVISPAENRCVLNGKVVAPWEFSSAIARGYSSALQLSGQVCEYTDNFNEISLWRVRHILRSTAGYHMALISSVNPANLASVAQRRTYVDNCLPNLDGTQFFKEAELTALMCGDVPRFEMHSTGMQLFEPKYLPEGIPFDMGAISGIASARTLSRILSKNRVANGADIIQGSLNALKLHYEENSNRENQEVRIKEDEKLERKSPGAAFQSCKDLLSNYLQSQFAKEKGKSQNSWYGTRANATGAYEYGHIGHDFYNGITGILYALIVAGVNPAVDLVESIQGALIEEFRKESSDLGGAYFGLSSTLLPWQFILRRYPQLDPSMLLAAAAEKLRQCLEAPFPLQYFTGMDLLCGAAGTLSVYSKLAQSAPELEIEDCCDRLFDILDTFARKNDHLFPLGSAVSTHSSGCLTGLSHGQIGIALCLSHYSSLTRDEQRRRQALLYIDGLIDWELGKFDDTDKNWPDYRVRMRRNGGKPAYEFGWSHGAPGIYAALHELVPFSANAKNFLKKNPYAITLRGRMKAGVRAKNDTICHGNLGIYSLSTRLLRNTDDLSPETEQDLRGFCGIDRILGLQGTLDPLSLFEINGLLTGTAGKMLAFLELHDGRQCVPFFHDESF